MPPLGNLIRLLTLLCLPVSGYALDVRQVANPWDNHYAPVGQVQSYPIPEGVAMTASRNGHPAAALTFHNNSDATLYLQIKATAEEDAPPLHLREGVHIRARLGQLVADALPRLGEEGGLAIAAGENRQIWLECSTQGLAAGNYHWNLHVLNLRDQSSLDIPVVLKLNPLLLPTHHPLSVLVWDCSIQGARGEHQTRLIEELGSHYVNTFHIIDQAPGRFDASGNMVEQPDFTELNQTIRPLINRGQLLLRCAQPRLEVVDSESNLSIFSDEGQKAYRLWLRALISNLEDLGLTYDDWLLYPYDERLDDNFHYTALAARAEDPWVRIYANPSSHTPRSDIDRQFEHLHVDYIQWAPVWLATEDNRDYVRQFRELTGVFTSTYWCPVIQKRLCPLGFYRRMAWTAWHHELDGVGYWTALGLEGYPTTGDWGGTPWDDFRARTANPTSVYPGRDNAIIPSRRWRAFRVGLEDYLLLNLLEEHAHKADPQSAQILQRAREISADNFNHRSLSELRQSIVQHLSEP